MDDQIRVISLWQPWATLCVKGFKQFETRSWKTPFRGTLLIHATKTLKQEHIFQCADNIHFKKYIDFSNAWKLPLGAIIGMVTLKEIYTAYTLVWSKDAEMIKILGKEKATEEFFFGDYTIGRYGWHLTDPVCFEEPIPCSGLQGLWTVPFELKDQIQELILKHKTK